MRNPVLLHLLENVRRLFGGLPPRRQAAALPWRENAGNIEILLVTSRERGRWVLPKGWPEGDELFCHAAAREAAEEAGINGNVSSIEAGRYYYEKRRPSGLELRCEVRVFPLKVCKEVDNWPDEKLRQRVWLPPDEAAVRVKEPELSRLIVDFGKNFQKPPA